MDESYLKTDESMKRDDFTGGGDDGTIEWSKSTHARSDSTPKIEEIYRYNHQDTPDKYSGHQYRKDRTRKSRNYPSRKSPRPDWKNIYNTKTRNHKSPRKNVHWLVDKFSRSCYIKFWNKLEDFGVSFLITLSLRNEFNSTVLGYPTRTSADRRFLVAFDCMLNS